MPLSFERFQGEGVFGVSSFYSDRFNQDKTGEEQEQDLGYVVGGVLPEPTSVLDALRSPSPLGSHSSNTTMTRSSSHGGGTTATATTIASGDDKCSQTGLDDLDGGQEQNILRLIMDPGSGFGVFDPGFGFGSGSVPVTENLNPLLSCSFPYQDQTHQLPIPEALLFSNPPSSPPAKRFNSGSHQPVFPFSDPDPGHDPFLVRRQQQFQFPFHQYQQTPSLVPVPPVMAGDEQTVIIEQLFNAAELIGNNNNNNGDHTVLAQGILARLNHHLNFNNNNNNKNPPFQRAASHISESLLSLINNNNKASPPLISPENLILRIAAYRTFSETSPFLQFVNFTANQSILESCSDELGFDRIHIIDFDVGYGGQWSSLMQELASRRRNRATSLKITVFAPPPATVSDEFELRFTEENLRSFAGEVKIPFEIELLSLELLLNPAYWPVSIRSSEKEAVAVNLPVNSVVSGYLPLILRFLKQISPNVVVCSDRGCDRSDTPFPNAVIHALQYYTTLLESLDQSQEDSSVERFWVQPSIEKVLMKRHRWIERSLPWRSLFTQCGFSPAGLSQTAEAQAECLLQRNPVRGFHVEKRQGSLVMCWQRKELVTVSAWKC